MFALKKYSGRNSEISLERTAGKNSKTAGKNSKISLQRTGRKVIIKEY